MINIRVRLFAVLRQLAGQETVVLTLPENATVRDLKEKLKRDFPQLASVGDQVLFAVDGHYAKDEQQLTDGVEVACIPPVSGG